MSVEKELEKYAPKFDMAAGYADSVAIIKENFQSMVENVVSNGFYLKHIRDNKLFMDGGYNTFAEFAKEEFGLSESSASRYISINKRFSIDGNSPFLMEDKKAFSKGQLWEMLRLTDEQLEQVTPDMTVKEIRALAMSQEIEIELEEESEEQIPGQLDIDFYPEVLPEGYKTQEEIETVEVVEVEKEEIPIEFAKAEVVIDGEYREIGRSEEIREKNRIVRAQIRDAFVKTFVERYQERLKNSESIEEEIDEILDRVHKSSYSFGCDGDVYIAEEAAGFVKVKKEGAGEFADMYSAVYLAQFAKAILCQTLSAYGLPKTEYEPNSTLTTVGCGHEHNCFSCAKECEIRQESRYCVEAPLGNPFSCTTMNVLECIWVDIGEKCQFINHELADKRAGDHSPVPCCKKCDVLCGYRCNRAGDDVYRQQETAERQSDEEIQENTQSEEKELPLESKEVTPHSVLKTAKIRLHNMFQTEKQHGQSEAGQRQIESQKIIVAALAAMVTELEEVVPEQEEAEQPELPVMTNNEQRGAFIDSYNEWPLWIETPETKEKYYRYDFENGTSFVVRAYFHRCFDYKSYAKKFEDRYTDGWGAQEYYILEEGKHFKDCLANRSRMIEFLKNMQK